jgi:hypothetical protein
MGELGMAALPGVVTKVSQPLFRRMDKSLAKRAKGGPPAGGSSARGL